MARSSDPSKAALWRRRLERFDCSSVSVARFCQREGVSVTSFYHWRQKLAAGTDRPELRRPSEPCAFQRVTVAPTTPSIAVHLPGGMRLEVPAGDYQSVRIVVRELLRSRPAYEERAASC